MKRLTISISDNLFEKLDRIENKSLFIRKLVERELEMLEDVPENGNQPWTQDITLLKGSVEELFSKLSEFEKHFMERVSISQDQESNSGSVIQYKDRSHLNAAEKSNDPIILPVSEETVTAQAPGSFGKGMELHTAEEMPSEETFDGMVIPAYGQNPVIVSAFNLPEIPEDIELSRLTSPVGGKMPEKMTGSGAKDLCDKDEQHTPSAPARELQLMSAGKSTLAVPDLSRKVNSVSEPAPVMPDFNQHVIPVSETAPLTPAFDQHLSPAGEQPIVMPQFKLPFAEGKEKPLFMPDMKATERTTESGGVKTSGNPEHMIPFMPIPDTINQASGPGKLKEPLFKLHGIPEHQRTEIIPPFIAPAMPETQENVQLPSFMAPKLPAMPPMQQQPKPSLADIPAGHSATGTNKQGKLEGNILMYMPRGAKVKKEIIKSLVSKQFSDRDIETKISELVTTGVLVLNADNGEHYLIRP